MTVKWGWQNIECTLEDAQSCVGPGWGKLVEELWVLCDQHNVDVFQIKEKFGGLRFYIGPAPGIVHDATWAAISTSETICENCGEPGEPRPRGWIKTLCDACDAERYG